MAGLREGGAAILRQARAIGLWRLTIGLTGIAAAYYLIGSSLSGREWGASRLLHDIVVLVPLTAWVITSSGPKVAITDRSRTFAFGHVCFVTLLLFMFWGWDFFPAYRPQSSGDFERLISPLISLLVSTMLLAAPGNADQEQSNEGRQARQTGAT